MAVFYTSSVVSKTRSDGADSVAYNYYLEADLLSQSIADNTSTVKFTLYMYAGANSGVLMWNTTKANAPTSNIVIAGTTYTSSISVGSSSTSPFIDGGKFRRYARSSTAAAIATKTLSISHDSDGAKTITCSFGWVKGSGTTTSYYPASFTSGSLSITIPQILRGGTISCNSSVLVDDDVSNFDYTITSYADYWYLLSYELDGNTYDVWNTATELDTASINLTISYATLLARLTTATSGNLKFTLKAYTDSSMTTLLATTTKTVVVSIDTSIFKPILTINSVTAGSSPIAGYIVAGYSTIAINFTVTKPTGVTGVTTTFNSSLFSPNYTTLESGTMVSTSPATSSEIDKGLLIQVTTVDSRGVSASQLVVAQTYGYKLPTITAQAIRVAADQSTVEDAAGDYVYLSATATVKDVDGQNSLQSLTCTYNNTTYALPAWVYLSPDDQGTFVFTATDNVASASVSVTVPRAYYALDLYDDGTALHMGVGLAGTIAEADKVTSGKPFYGTFVGNLTGNADTATSVSNADYADQLNLYPSGRPASANVTPAYEGKMYQFLSTSDMTTGKPALDGHILNFEWDNNNILGSQLFLAHSNLRNALGWRGSSSSAWHDWAYADLRRTIWEGSVQNGSSVNLNCSAYTYLVVWVHCYAVVFPVFVDLTTTPIYSRAGATGNTALRGSATVPVVNTSNTVRTYAAVIELNASKTTVYARNLGYFSGTTWTAQTNANYYMYRIEAYL